MKSTYKLGIAALMASVLTYTGCVNALTDDVDADASVSAAHVARGSKLSVTLPTSFSSINAEQYLTLTFSAPVTASSAEKAIKVYKFTGTTSFSGYANGDYITVAEAASNSTYTEEAITPEFIYSDNNKVVKLGLKNLSDVDAIRIVVEPSIESTAGVKFDKDGDNNYGETGDDEYMTVLANFTYGTGDRISVFGAISPYELADEQFATFSFDDYIGDGYASAVKASVSFVDKTTDYVSLLNSNVKAQYWDTTSKAWKAITLTAFSRIDTNTYATEDRTYRATFQKLPVTATKIRLVTDNVQNLKTSSSVRGYVRRYELNDKETFKILTSAEAYAYNSDKGYLENNLGYNKISGSFFNAYAVEENIKDNDTGNKVSYIMFSTENDYGTTYRTDSDFLKTDSFDNDLYNNAGDIYNHYSSTKYYTNSSNAETSYKYASYSFSGITGTASEVAKKLHFFTENYEEVTADVSKSYYTDSSKGTLVVVFSKPVTFAGSLLYVYADSSVAVTYNKTTYTYTRNVNPVWDTDGKYTDTNGNEREYQSYEDEYYNYYYSKTPDSKVTSVTYTVGAEYDGNKLVDKTYAEKVNGMRKIATVTLN